MIKKSFTYYLALSYLLLLVACNSPSKLYKNGLKSFKQGEYQLAIEDFNKSLKAGYIPMLNNFYIAESYRLSNRLKEAEPYYAQAVGKGIKEDEAKFYYGYALKAAGKYKEATEQFAKYVKFGTKREYIQRAEKEIKNIGKIEATLAKKTYTEVQNCDGINTAAAEFSPIFYKQYLLFSAARKEGTYKATGTGFTGIYKYTFDNANTCAGKADLFTPAINLEEVNEASPTFYQKDGETYMIFARGNTGSKKGAKNVDLYLSKLENENWTEPKLLAISDEEAWDSTPFVSPDGATLYFASDRKEDDFKNKTVGNIDLFSAQMNTDGQWSQVRNLGTDINTQGDEMFPSLRKNNKFYFASDGHPSVGGLDLFVAKKEQGTTEIQNLGLPLNSKADDFAIIFSTDSTGYFSSNRENGKGDDDIYSFVDHSINRKIVNYKLVIFTVEKDKKTLQEKPLSDVALTVYDAQNILVKKLTSKPDGSTEIINIDVQPHYLIVADKKDHYTVREIFAMQTKLIPREKLTKPETDTTFQVKLVLDKIEVGDVFVIDNIYYDYNKADIRPDAAIELNKLVEFLKDNPKIKVELSSHTDARGNDASNQKLSQRRAESAVNYIVSNGLNADRIVAKGYGEYQLKVKNAKTEDEHQKNRRTEIKVLEYEVSK